MMNLKNKMHAQGDAPVALITGASRGIGRSIAKKLSEAGYRVALSARDEKALEATALECGAAETFIVSADLALPESPQRLVDETVRTWGRLDVLVNNGALRTAKATTDDWGLYADVNLKALMQLTRLSLPYLEKSKNAAVVNISSIAGITGVAGRIGYCASKHGVTGFSRALFEDFREKGIKVSAICPGFVAADSAAAARDSSRIDPEAIAEAVLFVVKFPLSGCPTEIVIRPQRRMA